MTILLVLLAAACASRLPTSELLLSKEAFLSARFETEHSFH